MGIADFTRGAATRHGNVLSLCQALIKISSENPATDTKAMADAVGRVLEHPAIAVTRHEPLPGAVNVVAVLRGSQPGPRIVLNGHLDTFPIGPGTGWTHPPLGGARDGERIYGRGAGDMKAGVAILIHVMLALAEHQKTLCGELVLTLVADEETGGHWGTRWLLANIPESRGDFLLNADAGNPRTVRFGEKGSLWIRLDCAGRAGHGAHTHLGVNALELLMPAVQDVLALRNRPVQVPRDVLEAMTSAKAVSEAISGAGEFENLRGITVNLGSIQGGEVANIIPGQAYALLDIRYPPGCSGEEVRHALTEKLESHPKVRWSVIPGSDTEPAHTPPESPLVQTVLRHARCLAAPDAVTNMRVGCTDARFFRHEGIPAVVYGPAAYNMGGVDEHVIASEVTQVFDVYFAVISELLLPKETPV